MLIIINYWCILHISPFAPLGFQFALYTRDYVRLPTCTDTAVKHKQGTDNLGHTTQRAMKHSTFSTSRLYDLLMSASLSTLAIAIIVFN